MRFWQLCGLHAPLSPPSMSFDENNSFLHPSCCCCLQELLGHGKGVRALRWLGERELVSAGEDGAIKFWRLEAANPVG